MHRIIHEAEAVTGDPGKRYELIGRQLFSSNPGSGRDDFADRRLLAFTQRMQDDPALHDKLATWSVEAGRKLNDYGVDGQKSYLDILNHLPPAGPDYVRDLADQYNAVLKDSSYKDYSITPRARGEKLAEQIFEGATRFLLGLTPFAPITAAFDAHSSLSENTRLGIDLASGALGLVAGEGAAAFSERLAARGAGAAGEASRGHLPEHPVTPGDDKPAVPSGPSVQPGKVSGTGEGARPQGSAAPQGFVMDPGIAEATQRINGTRAGLPDDYAVQTASAALKPAPGQKGILTDKDGHTYITSGGKTYPVRFDADNGTWRVWQADNAYRPQYPVRLDAHGNWQVHNDVGLKGGGGEDQRRGIGAQQQANIRLDLQMRQMQLENQRQALLQQRQDLENQLHQFPGPQHANRTGLEQAYLAHTLQNRLAETNHRFQLVEQELQQLNHQLQQV